MYIFLSFLHKLKWNDKIATVVPGNEVGVIGELGERFIDNQRIEGNVSEMLDGAMQFVSRNMRTRTTINPQTGKREDRIDYPIRRTMKEYHLRQPEFIDERGSFIIVNKTTISSLMN